MAYSVDEREALRRADQMKRLLDNADWELLSQIGAEQLELRKALLMMPNHEFRDMGRPSDEFLKGAIFGLQLLLTTPARMVEDAAGIREAQAALMADQEEQENE